MTKLTNTVTYFSHDANAASRRTCKLLTSKFGNDGYAAWFRLLELLASEEGHFIEYIGSKREWLIGELHTDQENAGGGYGENTKADEILEKLAEIDAIDKELWGKNKIIWSGNFLKRVVDVYKNRRREIPCRPTSNLQQTYDKLGISYEEHTVGDANDNGSKLSKYKGGKYKNLTGDGKE